MSLTRKGSLIHHGLTWDTKVHTFSLQMTVIPALHYYLKMQVVELVLIYNVKKTGVKNGG